MFLIKPCFKSQYYYHIIKHGKPSPIYQTYVEHSETINLMFQNKTLDYTVTL